MSRTRASDARAGWEYRPPDPDGVAASVAYHDGGPTTTVRPARSNRKRGIGGNSMIDASIEEIGGGPTGPTGQSGPADPAVISPGLRAAVLECWVQATNAGGAVGFVAPVTAEEVAPEVDRSLGLVERGERTLVAVRSGPDLAGFGFLAWNDFAPFRHWATVRALQIHPKWQGRGLGRVLMDGIAEIGRAHGLEMLRLDYRGGLGLGAFYRRCGFVEVGRVPGAIRVAPGDERDQVYMLRRLAP